MFPHQLSYDAFDWDTDKAKQRWKERFGEYKYKMLLDFNECDKAR